MSVRLAWCTKGCYTNIKVPNTTITTTNNNNNTKIVIIINTLQSSMISIENSVAGTTYKWLGITQNKRRKNMSLQRAHDGSYMLNFSFFYLYRKKILFSFSPFSVSIDICAHPSSVSVTTSLQCGILSLSLSMNHSY